MRIRKLITSVVASSALAFATVANAAPSPVVASADAKDDGIVGAAGSLFVIVFEVGTVVYTVTFTVIAVTRSA